MRSEQKFMVPMLESEDGWGQKIDGYAGPFDDKEAAVDWMEAYNLKYNNETHVPSWYIAAQPPVPYREGIECEYIV